jgi:hypothetical protein
MGSSRSVIVTIVLAVLVAGGAVGGAVYLRSKRAPVEPAPSPEPPPVISTWCRTEPCSVLAETTVGTTKVELIADAGAKSGRLRINGDRLVEATITDRGATLTGKSLQCLDGTDIACLIKGERDSGGWLGEVVTGRADTWKLLERSYQSDAGHLSLAEVTGDGVQEVVAVQKGFFAKVFLLDGSELGCTKTVTKIEQLPGWPAPKPAKTQLKVCT